MMMKTTRVKTVKTLALERPRLLALTNSCETVKETESKAQLWGPSQFGLLVTDQKFIFCSKLKGVRLLPSMV